VTSRRYRGSAAFSIAYKRCSPGKLPAAVEAAIERELLREKAIVEDKRLPISGSNYSALRDRLKKMGIGKSRFFALLKEYWKGPEAFSIACERHSPVRPPSAVEAAIERELGDRSEAVRKP
jgi:hypothetical protein